MLDALLHSRPQVGQKILVLCQTVMLTYAPENCRALIFLLSPGRPRRFFDMVSLGPAAIGLLNFPTPMIEGGCISIVSATVESVSHVCPISGPDISIEIGRAHV